MSTMLKTTNPAAAAALQDPLKGKPAVGQRVQFKCRIGMGRAGRDLYAADVLHVHKNGLVDLWVCFGPEDYREMMNQDQVSEHRDHGWKYMPDPRIDALAESLGDLKAAIFGEFKPPSKSVIDILADFEGRLKDAPAKAPAKARGTRSAS